MNFVSDRPSEHAPPELVSADRYTDVSRRADIDGLRAFAAGSVLLFHFFPAACPGGFIGVDIFFVISGFVVSQSLLKGLESGSFSILGFYGRRIRRLYPTLIAVVFLSLLASWALHLGTDFRRAGKDAFIALGYLTNMQLAAGTGYFEPSSGTRLFLHFWSLAVEEQYYIFWPVTLALIYKSRYKILIPAAIMIVSFAMFWLLNKNHADLSFYSLPTRAWQFMAGAIAALLNRRMPGASVGLTARSGLIMTAPPLGASGAILICCLAYPADGTYSAWLALVPTVGTVILIGSRASLFNQRILGSAVSVWIGNRSYALYLWHWPMIVIYKEYSGVDITLQTSSALMLLTILAADLSFRYIELPVRNLSARKFAVATRNLLAAQVVMMLAAFLIWKGALPEHRTDLKSFSDAQQDWVEIDTLVALTGTKPGTVLFFGDSYMQQIYPRVLRNLLDKDRAHRSVIFYTTPGCAPMPDVNRRSNRNCLPFSETGFARADDPETSHVVIGGSWLGFMNRGDYYSRHDPSRTSIDFETSDGDVVFDALASRIASLVRKGKKVTLILEWPSDRKANPRILAKARSGDAFFIPISDHRARTDRINERLRKIAHDANASTLNPEHWLCDSVRCLLKTANGQPIFKDGSHINATFARENLNALDSILTD